MAGGGVPRLNGAGTESDGGNQKPGHIRLHAGFSGGQPLLQGLPGEAAPGQRLLQPGGHRPVHGVGIDLRLPHNAAFHLQGNLHAASGEPLLAFKGKGNLLTIQPFPASVALPQGVNTGPVQSLLRELLQGRTVNLGKGLRHGSF